MSQSRESIFEFDVESLPFYAPEPMNQSSTDYQPLPLSDWRVEIIRRSPKICAGALLAFGVLFFGSLMIANSSSDLKAWRARALENSGTALLGLAATAGGAYLLKEDKDDVH